jgi:hypothetical protein
MAKKKKAARKVHAKLVDFTTKPPKITPYKEVLRDKFAIEAIGGLIAARGMEVANPTSMVKNAWSFANEMMEYRNWIDEINPLADDEAIEAMPSDQPEGGG